MKIQNKFCLGIASLMLAAGVANAQSVDGKIVPAAEEEDEAILFKVHDITPVKALNGDVVTSCDFYVTFYNRSKKDINGAEIDLTWVDNSLTSVILDEKKESAEKYAEGETSDANYSYTQEKNPPHLMAEIKMPAIKSYKQITAKQNIKTDRCYALLEDLSINVKSCAVKQSGDANMAGNDTCNGLFRFVSQESPEYYTDFQKISYTTQRNADVKERANMVKELEEQYQQTIRNMDLLSKTLAEIK